MPAHASADAKKGRQSLSLDLSCSSVLLYLPHPGHHGAKQMFVHQTVAGDSKKATVSFLPAGLPVPWCHVCPSVSELMLSLAQVWLSQGNK